MIVVSPLLALIKDQCERLQHIGISSTSLSDVNTQEEIHFVESGCYSVIYAKHQSHCLRMNKIMAKNVIFRFVLLLFGMPPKSCSI